jgi:capsular exopolysaccharide synthesis family protein
MNQLVYGSGFSNSHPDATGDRVSSFGRRSVVWPVFRRHALLISVFAVVGAVAATVLVRLKGPVYSGVATVRVYQKATELSAPDVIRLSSTNDVSTELEMLQSSTLAEEVVDSLGLQLQVASPNVPRTEIVTAVKIARDAAPTKLTLLRRGNRFVAENANVAAEATPLSLGAMTRTQAGIQLDLAPTALRYSTIDLNVVGFNRALDALAGSLKITRPSMDAGIIDIAYTNRDPSLARDVPNVLAARFIADRLDVNRSTAAQTVAFLQQQVATISDQLTSKEDSLRQVSESEGVVSLPEQANAGVNHTADLQAQRDQLQAEQGALDTLLTRAQAAASSNPTGPSPFRSLLAFPTLIKNQSLGQLLTSLSTAEDRRSELLIRRTAADPDVLAVTARIKQIEGEIRAIVTTYAAGLNGQLQGLDAALARDRSELEQIPAKQVRVASLQREVQSLSAIVLQLQARLKDAQIAEGVDDGSVRLVDHARLPTLPVGHPFLLVVAATIIMAIAGTMFALVREYRDESIHSGEDLRAATGTDIVGWIPSEQPARTKALFDRVPGRNDARTIEKNDATAALARVALIGVAAASAKYPTPLTDAYTQLHTNLSFGEDGMPKIILFTSALPGDGKTTTATNFAAMLVRCGRRVLLIDADLRRGGISSQLHLTGGAGLAEIIAGTAQFGRAVRSCAVGRHGSLAVLPSGTLAGDPSEALGSPRVGELLNWLRPHFDVVVIDSSPINIVADALLLTRHVDGVLIVGRAGVTPYAAVVEAAAKIQRVRGPLIGAVLNDIDPRRDRSYGALRWQEYGNAYYAEMRDALSDA